MQYCGIECHIFCCGIFIDINISKKKDDLHKCLMRLCMIRQNYIDDVNTKS